MSRLDASASWEVFKDIIQKVSIEVLGYPERKHRDWFDEHDPLIRPMLTELHRLRIVSIESEDDDEKAQAYRLNKCSVQKSLRETKDLWWKERSDELQSTDDRHEYKVF